ncbi:iron chelate uptake ABC transporter family permease subunit [Kibdelosporangium lantanae]
MSLVLRNRGFSVRVDTRATVTCVVLLVVAVVIAFISLTTGDYQLTVREVWDTFLGQGPPGADFIVLTLRLPRLLTALLVGAAFAISGAVLQRLTSNPLGSPDVIGFTQGAATGALAVIVLTDGGMAETAGGALVGGIVTSVLIYLLAYQRGVQGYRLVLIGIGVSAMLIAVNHYLITHADLRDAVTAQAWQVGGLNGRGWEHVIPISITLAVLLPVTAYYCRRLGVLEMGDDSARALGVPVERTRLVLVAVSVLLVSIGTAAAGPITFVALAAPQIARRLAGTPSPGPMSAGLTGAVLLMGSDLAVQRLFTTVQLPVGIATGVLGGLYLGWLLAYEWRRRR